MVEREQRGEDGSKVCKIFLEIHQATQLELNEGGIHLNFPNYFILVHVSETFDSSLT